jgi:hypothetical protein
MRLAQEQGYETIFLRPPNTVKGIIKAITKHNPGIIALSYRLTPETAVKIVNELIKSLPSEMIEKKWIFGGTSPVCRVIKTLKFFEHYFNGDATEIDVLGFLGNHNKEIKVKETFPQNLNDRMFWMLPFPLLRAHFGLPSFEETKKGITKLAKAKVLDVISLGPDQNFQENYFCPEEIHEEESGAGGVHIRSEEDLTTLYEASRCGNYPLLRCYSGTRNLIKMAELLHRTINNAWGATPLFWYSELDGRSDRSLLDAITENQANMAWHGSRGIPFESNEAHHWSLRSAPDAVAVVAAFLGAYNAKKAGVRTYISQLMFDTPLGIFPRFDLAKMIAKTELIEALHDDNFHSIRQVRTGLLSFPEDLDLSKGQLASSMQIAMLMKPQIIHVVSYCEANHAAEAKEVIESTKIVRKIINNSLRGLPDVSADSELLIYKSYLIDEVMYILKTIDNLADEDVEDPLTDPKTLTRAVKIGILDAPHLEGSNTARGDIQTAMLDGKSLSINPETRQPISEKERIKEIMERERLLRSIRH